MRTLRKRQDLRRLVLVFALLGLLILLLFLPIPLPYSLEVQGRVLPAQEWLLVRDTGGRVTSTLYDYRVALTEEYAVAQFERQDAMRFRFSEPVRRARTVALGDTIGTVYSSQTSRLLAQAEGQLEAERATLRLFATGEKASVVAEARNRIARAQAQVESQQKTVERLRTLVDRNAAAQEDLDIAEGELAVFEAEVGIAQAALETAQTGAKQEQIDLVQARIQTLESEIAALQSRMGDFQLIAPFSGTILHPAARDTLLALADTSAFMVVMPVMKEARAFITPGQAVHIEGLSGNTGVEGRLVRIENHVEQVDGRDVVFAHALVEFVPDRAFLPGMLTRCRIRTGTVTPLEYLRRLASSVVSV